jgi:predicted RNA-binding Zn-ribbon protein involved in translation (DUF1610 family)
MGAAYAGSSSLTIRCDYCDMPQELSFDATEFVCSGCGRRILARVCNSCYWVAQVDASFETWECPGCNKLCRISTSIGTTNTQLVCPHCQVKGGVKTHHTKVKTRISGAKATGAVLTRRVSLLGTGLSRKRVVTHGYCTNCGTRWTIECPRSSGDRASVS